MNIEDWKQAWENNRTGFHKNRPHPLLVSHLKALDLAPGSRVFLPLCGKSLDMGWLMSRGYRVAGAEVSRLAINQLFDELGLTPHVSNLGKLTHYRANRIDIFVGDVFDLSSAVLGPVDAIYDRAALVALSEDLHSRYTRHLIELSNGTDQLLITFEYDESLKSGPPFSIDENEIKRHYDTVYQVELLEQVNLSRGLSGTSTSSENIWLLKNLDGQS